MSVWVDAPLRGRGIGRELMRGMTRQAARARSEGDLPVGRGGQSRATSLRLGGLRPIEGREDDDVMILELLGQP